MISGLATDMETLPHHPHVNLIGGGMSPHTPPVFNHQGSCCRPTSQCHAYFKVSFPANLSQSEHCSRGLGKAASRPARVPNDDPSLESDLSLLTSLIKWVIDMINPTPQWDSDEQRSEAMAHLDCCMRQYRASCADPPKAHTVIWRDPARRCSNGPDHVEYEGDGVGKDGLADAVDALPGPVDLGEAEGLELPKVEEDVKVEEEKKGDGEERANYEVKADEEANVDEAMVDEAKVDEAKGDEAKGDEAKGDEANVDEIKVDEVKADEANVDEAGEQN